MNSSIIKESEKSRAFNAMIESIYNEQMDKIEAMKIQHLDAMERRMNFDAHKRKSQETKENIQTEMDSLASFLEALKWVVETPEEELINQEIPTEDATLVMANTSSAAMQKVATQRFQQKMTAQKRQEFLDALAVFQTKKEHEDTIRKITLAVEAEEEEVVVVEKKVPTPPPSPPRRSPRKPKTSSPSERPQYKLAKESYAALQRVNEMRRISTMAKQLGDLKERRYHEVSKLNV